MKNRLFVMLLGIFVTSSLAIANVSSDIGDLSDSFKSAHEARSFAEISKLINWESVRKPMRKKIEVYTSATFGLKIKNIEIETVSAGQFQQQKIGNKEVKPNLDVSHIMKVHFDVDEASLEAGNKDTIVYLIGQKEGNYQIAVFVKTGASANKHYH